MRALSGSLCVRACVGGVMVLLLLLLRCKYLVPGGRRGEGRGNYRLCDICTRVQAWREGAVL